MSPISRILAILGIPLKRIPGIQPKDTTKIVVMFHLMNSPMFIVGRITKVSVEDWISENMQDQGIEIEVESFEGNGVLSKEGNDGSWIWNNEIAPNKDASVRADSLIFLYADPG